MHLALSCCRSLNPKKDITEAHGQSMDNSYPKATLIRYAPK
jgi:hypothetical protein